MRLAKQLMAAHDVKSSLEQVIRKVFSAAEEYALANNVDQQKFQPCLVAVGKTKPKELLEEVYKCGQRHFGENYVQELFDKAEYFQEKGVSDIKWHFIGKLQRNKSNKLCSVPNLYMVETLDSAKLANTLNTSWGRASSSQKLKVLVQVNTSDEKTKGGCQTEEALDLVKFVREECPNLEFAGLMSIGAPGHNYTQGPNPDFQRMVSLKKEVCQKFELSEYEVNLSMGMSADFQEAIRMGSTIIRVGSTIFGARDLVKGGGSKPDQQANVSDSTVANSDSIKRTALTSNELESLDSLKISK